MNILEQCQIWHENDEYQKIIQALEAIPAAERTPEQDCELARAYNNQATQEAATAEGRVLLQRAIELLKPHQEYFQGDYLWNFRMGYAYYYLEQDGIARRYFEQALAARPEDEDARRFVERCNSGIALPRFGANFRERTAKAWAAFAENEAALRRFMDEDKNHERGDELIARCSEILELAFYDVAFEMGFNGEKHELILTPEGDKVRLFEMVYFRRHAPAEVLENWNILVGRKPNSQVGLRFDKWEVHGDDVQVWVDKQDENNIDLTLFCEKLLPALAEEDGRVWWLMTTLTDFVLGEIACMNYIDKYDVVSQPREEPAILLSQLPEALAEMGLQLDNDPEALLEKYTCYEMQPNEDPDADWRQDIIVGSTCCIPLLNGYMGNDECFMDKLHADGAVAGFLAYPVDTLTDKEGSQRLFAFRDALEEALLAKAGEDAVTLTGGATGIYGAYVDFIAWDLLAVLDAAKEFFAAGDVPWASFHVFRRNAGSVRIWQQEADFITYNPEAEDAFYQQLEQWNDHDEFSRCIKSLDTIPSELRNYRSGYALARALENWAIIGDHDQGTPRAQGDKALLRAVQVLEEVREAGQSLAEWNMRMAYAYQYLEQEEKAIPYARRWAELAPDDEKAGMVIEECKEELRKKQPQAVKTKTGC